jgi:hypothetical protein
MTSLPLPIGLFASSLTAFRAIGMPRFTLLSALPAFQDILLQDRLRLEVLSFVVGSLLSLALPFCCTYRTEPAPGYKFSTTCTAGNALLCYRLAYPCRPSEFELIEQVQSCPVCFCAVASAVRISSGLSVRSVAASLKEASLDILSHRIIRPCLKQLLLLVVSLFDIGVGTLSSPDGSLSTRQNIAHASNLPSLTAQDLLVFVGPCFCRRASCICHLP